MKPWLKLFRITMISRVLTAYATSPTGRSQLMLVSEESAISASEVTYVEMLQPLAEEGKLDNDPVHKARVQRITERLVEQVVMMRPATRDWDWDWSIRIIDDPETVNAWAMASGKMAHYTGLVEQIEPTDDELAQVLGHKISHALAKHTAEKMSVALATQLGMAAVAAKSDKQGTLVGATLAAKVAEEPPNSRTAKAEADRIGIELAAKAGYDPRAAATLWRKMAMLSGRKYPSF